MTYSTAVKMSEQPSQEIWKNQINILLTRKSHTKDHMVYNLIYTKFKNKQSNTQVFWDDYLGDCRDGVSRVLVTFYS